METYFLPNTDLVITSSKRESLTSGVGDIVYMVVKSKNTVQDGDFIFARSIHTGFVKAYRIDSARYISDIFGSMDWYYALKVSAVWLKAKDLPKLNYSLTDKNFHKLLRQAITESKTYDKKKTKTQEMSS